MIAIDELARLLAKLSGPLLTAADLNETETPAAALRDVLLEALRCEA